ncbi:glutathione S-transferase [Rhizobium sp. XQZ8]|uniref:glutathione S-transferase family protein n=1 Tax=Rhizobium populisoli TaxID=2859785 RepID=UPI001C6787D7|nr:glutathione S-transferase [Rhizobium populisoli]MBW6422321.1 glutathione S-transferase [Rhizobium populisoli]
MKLYYQTHSPFARKVLVFIHESGLADRIEVIDHETSPLVRNRDVFSENPLGKVPVLIRPGLSALFDSDVICAYLDTLHNRKKLIPLEGEARWEALRLQALAQGLAETGIALRWETARRPAHLRYEPLQEGYAQKLQESYRWLEGELDDGAGLHVGHIALATALSWIRFRDLPAPQPESRVAHWLSRFEERPSMQLTPLSGETVDR